MTLSIAYITGGKVHSDFLMSYHNFLFRDIVARKLFRSMTASQGAFHADNRNRAVEIFLKQGSDWLLFIDTDIEYTPDHVYRLLDAAAADKRRKVLTGLYFIFHPEGKLNPCWFHYNKHTGSYDVVPHSFLSSGVKKIDSSGAGFLMIHREVALAVAKLPQYQDDTQKWFGHDIVRMIVPGEYAAGDKVPFHNVRLGEDMTFCKRAKEAGYTLFAHGDVIVTHIKEVKVDLEYFARWHGIEIQKQKNPEVALRAAAPPKFVRVVNNTTTHQIATATAPLAIEHFPTAS